MLLEKYEIIPALITPFDERENIMERELGELVDLLISQGAKSLYVCGSTGECHLMSAHERMRVCDIVCQRAKGRAKVICQVGTAGTKLSVELALHAQRAGAHALSASPPFYYKYTPAEVAAYYQRLIQETELPWIIYHIPSLTGFAFSPADIQQYAENPRIIGVKYTDYNFYAMEQMRRRAPRFTFFSGHDEVLLAGLSMGAEAAIGSTYNFMIKNAIKIRDGFERGDMAAAAQAQSELNRILDVVLRAGNIPATKYMLRAYGLDCGICRSPRENLGSAEKAMLDRIMPEIMK